MICRHLVGCRWKKYNQRIVSKAHRLKQPIGFLHQNIVKKCVLKNDHSKFVRTVASTFYVPENSPKITTDISLANARLSTFRIYPTLKNLTTFITDLLNFKCKSIFQRCVRYFNTCQNCVSEKKYQEWLMTRNAPDTIIKCFNELAEDFDENELHDIIADYC